MSKELLVEEYSGSSVLLEPLDSGLAAPHALMQVVQGTSYIPVINVESSDVPLDTHSLTGAFAGTTCELPFGVTELPPTVAAVTPQSVSTLVQGQIAALEFSHLPADA